MSAFDVKKARLTTFQRAAVYAALAILAAVFGWIILYITSSGDEPPIRVKNGGSMEITTCNGQGWDTDATAYMPAAEHSRNRFVVIISATGTSCPSTPVQGTQVRLRYSDDTNSDRVVIQAGARTKVMPRNVLTPGTDPNTLHYRAASNDAQRFISRIEIIGTGAPVACDIPSRQALKYINVCSGTSCRACP